MIKITLDTVKSLEIVRNKRELYDEIELDSSKLIGRGIFRHAVKYGFWALKKDGKMTIHGKEDTGFGFAIGRIKFWQIRAEVYKLLKKEIITLTDIQTEGYLVVKKMNKTSVETFVSIGFVFGGDREELRLLKNSFENISKRDGIEILICGPSECASETLFEEYNVKYISMDLADPNRILYTKKKNELFKRAKYSIVIIAHARILISIQLVSEIFKYNFDVITPRITYQNEKGIHAYLDYLLVENYALLTIRKHHTVGLKQVGQKYLYQLKNKVPYVDGGLTIFNKESITFPPYSEYLGWGEAEDLEMCERLNQQGYLIDFAPDLICCTQINKLDFDSTKIQRIKTRICKYFLK
jgi:hypothetical protein